jgi:predicted ATPase
VILAAATGLGNSYADPMVERAVSRAWELCGRAGTTPHLVPVYLGFFALYLVRGRLDEALTSTEKLLELAERLGDRELFLIGHQRKGFALLCRAEFPAARFHLEEALTYSDAARASFDNSIVYPVVDGLCDLCLVLWMMGFPEQAVARSREAIERARQIGYSYTLGYALSFAAELHMFRNEPDRVLEVTEELVALSTQQSLLGWLSYGVFLRGWAMATLGNVAEGMGMMRHVIEGNRAAGVRIGQPSRFASLARVCVRAGLPDEGLAAVEEALGLSADGAHHFVDAELWRLRGELLAVRGEDVEAEEAFRRALETARGQGARSLELRTAMSLARFQAPRGGKDAARELLARVYEGFTEGFDTPDLREARTLLDELL